MKIRTLGDMIAGQKLKTVTPDDKVRTACITMASGNVGALPVVDAEGTLVGMISERDVIKRSVIVYRPADETPVSHIMTPKPKWLRPDAIPEEAAKLMRAKGFRHLPVCEDRRVLGIVSSRDFDADGNPAQARPVLAKFRQLAARNKQPPSELRSA